jgi:superfamily II RNA helicase
LLGLSATIPNAQELADWISEIKKHDVAVITKKERAVPLEHYVFSKRTGPTTLKQLIKNEEERREKSQDSYDFRDGARRRMPETSHRDLIRWIARAKGLPCLYFVFSRRMCEEKAFELAQEQDFLTIEEKDRAEEVIDRLVKEYELTSWRTIPHVKDLLLKGIAYHHAGLLPALKEIVETLFGLNLIRVMYATETFAVGINYPVRSVCFDAPTKWDGVTFRPMTTLEYFQMAGRAGRRGIDERGFVYTLADLDRYRPEDFPSTRVEDIEELRSRFNLSYNSVLNLNRNHSSSEIGRILDQNFATFQARNDKIYLEQRLKKLLDKYAVFDGGICAEWNGLACPRNREEVERKIRRQERKLRYIKGRRARSAIMEEIAEQRKLLMTATAQKCSPEKMQVCTADINRFEEFQRGKENLEAQIANIKVVGRFNDDLELKVSILEEMDYLKLGELLPRGEFAAQIYAQELLITEIYFQGLFHDWSEDQINAVIVAVDYEPRKGEFAPKNLPYDAKPIRRIIRQLLYQYGVEERDARFHPSLSPLAYKWSQGCTFLELQQEALHLQEGDIVSAFRRGIDLLRQIRNACIKDDPILAGKLKNCMDKMDRDLVKVNL